MNSDQKPDSLKTPDGEAQHQTTMTFTGKSNVLNSKTQKYMFWIQKNKHLFFFKLQRHPRNTQRTVPLCQFKE